MLIAVRWKMSADAKKKAFYGPPSPAINPTRLSRPAGAKTSQRAVMLPVNEHEDRSNSSGSAGLREAPPIHPSSTRIIRGVSPGGGPPLPRESWTEASEGKAV